MSLLFKILYAAHANGVHHKLALDALRDLDVENKDNWIKLFLKHSDVYLEGSKEPDKVFKDFKNHVLHVNDNYWGGAEEKCREWYDELVRRLVEEKWNDAIYSAGVLSHYFTDPIMPFHTAQSEAESAIHGAVEWSVNKSYNRLRAAALKAYPLLAVLPPDERVDFAAQMVRSGAEASNRYYSHLIAHYNFDRGVIEPSEGFNELGEAIVSELLLYAARGLAVVLSEAIKSSGSVPPKVNVSAQTVVAGLKIPVKWVTRKLDEQEDRRLVEAMYDELQETGRVVDTLREDDLFIRACHQEEVRGGKIFGGTVVSGTETVGDAEADVSPAASAERDLFDDIEVLSPAEMDGRDFERRRGEVNLPEKRPDQGQSFYLSLTDNVEDAPSIGVKTAKRLFVIDIKTVEDLLEANPDVTAEELNVRYISSQVVRQWQDQAKLQCEIPRLKGYAAQYLVGCGYRDKQSVIDANPETLLVDLHAFLLTSAGERLLRVGSEPDLEGVKSWIDKAKSTFDEFAA